MKTAEQLISDAGLRATKARVAVLNALLHSKSALSHTDIFGYIQSSLALDRVTVYRTLDLLQQKSLIHKISTEDRSWKYQLNNHSQSANNLRFITKNMINHHHAHLHCTQCGHIQCIDEVEAQIPQSILDTFQVSRIELTLKGICPECQRKHP